MDPNATWAEAQAAIAADDRETALVLLNALLRWMDLGGFPPEGVELTEIRDARTRLVPCRKVFIPEPERNKPREG